MQFVDTGPLIVHFVVRGKPVSKQRPRSGQGRTYTPKETVVAEQAIAWLFTASWKPIPQYSFQDIIEGTARLQLEVDAYFPGKSPQDWDNVGKLVSDALNQVAYKDDRQIMRAIVQKIEHDPRPRTEVRLYLME